MSDIGLRTVLNDENDESQKFIGGLTFIIKDYQRRYDAKRRQRNHKSARRGGLYKKSVANAVIVVGTVIRFTVYKKSGIIYKSTR